MSHKAESALELPEEVVAAAAMQLAKVEGPLLERHLEGALEAALGESHTVHCQHSLKLDGWHGRLGPADIALTEPGSAPALIECKWGGTALWNCAWDVVKLATAQAEGAATTGYLVAGAPTDTWGSEPEGSGLFQDRDWSLENFLARYARYFAFWREDIQNYPKRLPAAFRTDRAATVPLTQLGVAHEIRVARVTATDRTLLPVAYAPIVAAWRLTP